MSFESDIYPYTWNERFIKREKLIEKNLKI